MDTGGEATPEISTVYAAVSGKPNPESTGLLPFKVYKRRWFVLLVLCLLNCSNATRDSAVVFSNGGTSLSSC
ncbi:hypothetical protein AMECASPLE_037300 [Ameca splendens]|uniref:Uncharacterized protein n=1 Tax=Ameca splendens TaxID=208324 RepID=A0ABV0YJ06_9TELE